MQGAVQKHKLGYEWMRVGFATPRFKSAALALFLCTVLVLAFWTYGELPAGEWRPALFSALYFAAALIYVNLGVWAHEQLHCLPYRNPTYEKRTHIFYVRRYIVTLNGYYRVTGPIGYRILRRALLGPMLLVIAWLMLAWLSTLLLPGWWQPLLLMMAAISLMDMIHDLYWLWQIRRIRDRGKYWDMGHALEAVWQA